jgi:hypothetical protein
MPKFSPEMHHSGRWRQGVDGVKWCELFRELVSHHHRQPSYDIPKDERHGAFQRTENDQNHFCIMNPETDVIINIQTSCTRDEAVAKLLGWSRGRYFPQSVQVTEHGIDKVDLERVAQFEGSVQEQLAAIYEKARSEFIDAAEAGESHETLSILEGKVYECRALVDKAAEYFLDLDDELSSPEMLRIDRMRTEREGQTYVTLRSLAEWSQQKYGIDISKAPVTDGERCDVAAPEPEKYSGRAADLTEIDKLNLALAALLAVVAENNKYQKKEGDPNISQISKAMERHMKLQFPRSRGFGESTFRGRLEDAEAAIAKYRRSLAR